MSHDTLTEVERYARGAIDDALLLGQVVDRIIPLTEEQADDYGLDTVEPDALDFLEYVALEVYGTVRIGTYQSAEPRSVVVVTGIGGPHVEFEVWPNGHVEGRAYWGGEEAKAYGMSYDLFDFLAELVTS